MSLDKRDVEAALVKKGFQSKEGDHTYFTYWTELGQKTSVWTKTSHGSSSKVLNDYLISMMAKQCGLNNSQFKQLIACPLTRLELEKTLVNNGRIKIK